MALRPGSELQEVQWLVRKSGNLILGPFWTDQIRSMVLQGMLEADDELCPENSYWFALHENQEIKKFLGLDQVVLKDSHLEEERTVPDIKTGAPAASQSNAPKLKPVATHFPRVLSSAAPMRPEPSSALLGLEKARFWGFVLFICLVLAGLGIVWVLKALNG